MNSKHESETLFVGATFSSDLPKEHGEKLRVKISFGTFNEHEKENYNHGLRYEENI